MEIIALDEDQRDCLQELMNVAYGSATAAISKIINEFATLNIPEITLMPSSELSNYLTNKLEIKGEQYLGKQLIDGSLSGESLFIMDTESAINLARHFDLEDDEMDDEELSDVVLEVTNILSSSTMGRLSSELGGVISFLPPHVDKIESIDAITDRYTTKYNQIFSISTELAFKSQVIRGELLLLTKDESLIWLKSALDKVLDEF